MKEGRRSRERRRREEGKDRKKKNTKPRKRRPAEVRSRVRERRDGGGQALSLPCETRDSFGEGQGLTLQMCLVSKRRL